MTEKLSDSPSEIQAKLDGIVDWVSIACGCMGPQRGEPVCPCAMRRVIRYRGMWIELKPLEIEPQALSYDVVLTDFEPHKKIEVIKCVRDITRLSLTDAKNLVENLPATISRDCWLSNAEAQREVFENIGATVELKPR